MLGSVAKVIGDQTQSRNSTSPADRRHYVGGFHNDWDDYLVLAKFGYNRQYQAAIDMSPFYADIGYNSRVPADLQIMNLENTSAVTLIQTQEHLLRELQAKARIAAERMKLLYDRGRRDQQFQEGEMVLISTKNVNEEVVEAVRNFFAAKWIGLYEIIKVLHVGASYEVNLPPELKIHSVFHTMVLKKFRKDTTAVQRDSTTPTVRLKDGSEGHLIEIILDHRISGDNGEQYKCKWVGRNDDITWEPTANLMSVPGLIREYHRQANGLPMRTSKRLQAKHPSAANAAHVARQYVTSMKFCPAEVVPRS
ncbi:Chromo (CHRromatin Organization MOdifier) domain [Phytophthora infestans]|uniref:Chromo (CHRromatin Organization MOdifier) domain n=1 Tax=Phytophthora infestans TaxID=4787 RepID=A0A8S9V810_PHYIN|nr:Chromo (CHRromatin Organization MOdifier) domain [Phytophthora infestans]